MTKTTALSRPSMGQCAEACLAYTYTNNVLPCLHFTFDTATQSCKLSGHKKRSSTFSGTTDTQATFVRRKKLLPCNRLTKSVAPLATEVAGLPRVLLLGDSVSIGYTLQTRRSLAGKANVHRPPANCQSSRHAITPYTDSDVSRRGKRAHTTVNQTPLDHWLAAKPSWDAIHFNFGLHDLKRMGVDGSDIAYLAGRHSVKPQNSTAATRSAMRDIIKYSGAALAPVSAQRNVNSTALRKLLRNVPLEEYTNNLDRIVTRLKKTGAKLIWKTTTPIMPGSLGRVVGDEVLYNEAAALVMSRHRVPISDQYTYLVSKQNEYMLPADVHFNYQGYNVLAKDVADAVVNALRRK